MMCVCSGDGVTPMISTHSCVKIHLHSNDAVIICGKSNGHAGPQQQQTNANPSPHSRMYGMSRPMRILKTEVSVRMIGAVCMYVCMNVCV